MKVAILLTGHMRTFARCLPTQAWHVFRHYPEAEFFVSTVSDADSFKAQLLRERYPNNRVEIDIVEQQPELTIPVGPTDPNWQLGQPYTHEPYALSVPPQAVLRQLWQLNRAWEHFVGCVDPFGYDLIIRMRPDSWFHSFEVPDAGRITASVASTPWWGRFGGINDRFAICGAAAADAYHSTFQMLSILLAEGCPLHPESLVKASLEQKGCRVDTRLRAEFSTLKHDSIRPPEIIPIDLAHAGLG